MIRVAVLDDYMKVALKCADWSLLSNGVQVQIFHHYLGNEDAVAEALLEFEVLVVMRERTAFPASLLQRLPNLQLLVTTGMRNLSIEMDAARAQGIDVCGTQMLSYPAFEHAWALILGLAKNIAREDRMMHEGGWQHDATSGLNGRTLGVMGLGRLGSQAARVGKAFEMNVIAWSQNLDDERAAEVGVTRVDKETLLAESDFLTIHQILSDRTRGLVGAAELAQMKPAAYLINTSRGPIVDEAALVDALRDRRIAGAGLDVFDVEPLPADHALRSLDNVLLTGHTGYSTREAFDVMYPQCVEAVRAWIDRDPVRVLNG
ncbi:MAG: phosphoglycerate dehydrogenase-like enzyme [Gammaproteobacteria bacterium]|jgi:phosphoglycerate dehydrogenase-like enzyme